MLKVYIYDIIINTLFNNNVLIEVFKRRKTLNVIITGASSGIGLVTARYLTSKGHKVFGLSRRKINGEPFTSISCDITDYAQVKKVFKEIVDMVGNIDALINNAGMGISGAAEYAAEEDIEKIFDVNLLALINACKEVTPYLKKNGGGKIINISSVAAVIPIPFQAYYSASKAAVLSFSYALRLELKDFNIDVSAVLPGDTKTSFTSARVKNQSGDDYNGRIERSVNKMEKDEQKGMPPESISKVIFKMLKKKRSPAAKTVGVGYKMITFLSKILPTRLMLFIVKKLYG